MGRIQLISDCHDDLLPWKERVVRASLGTTTGMIVLAILGRQPKPGMKAMRFGTTCTIKKDGMVWTQVTYAGKLGAFHKVGPIEAVRDNLRRLADTCKLNDVDREALFEELRKWVGKDERATSIVEK